MAYIWTNTYLLYYSSAKFIGNGIFGIKNVLNSFQEMRNFHFIAKNIFSAFIGSNFF
jgi:hypothetical protein